MKRSLSEKEISEAIAGILIDAVNRIDNIASTFTHFDVIFEPMGVTEQRTGRFESSGHEECRPIDAMKLKYIFANDLTIRWPDVILIGWISGNG